MKNKSYKYKNRHFLGLFLLNILASSLNAQINQQIKNQLVISDSNHIQILTTTDGSSNFGRITEIGEYEVKFETAMGILTITINKIQNIKQIEKKFIKKGQYWYANPNKTRLYFAPTAFTLKKGEGYIADYYLFFPMAAYGFTDNLTLGAGFSLFPTSDVDEQIFYFMSKIGIKAADDFNLAFGSLICKLPDFSDDDFQLVGILYGVSTFGKPDASVTIGLGYGFVGNELAEKPMVSIGGEYRISRRMSFVSENWIFPGLDQPLISYGLRFFGEKLCVDFALLNFIGDGMLFPGIPYIDFVIAFNA